jgi:predicted component of type VI protein secretion system
MFEAYHKTHLIPALILYHPSRAVVLRAIDLFADLRRQDVLRLAVRLLRHPDHEIRAAALRLYAASSPDDAPLRRCLRDDSTAVRATAIVGLVASGTMPDKEAEPLLKEMIDGPSAEARHALALSLRLLPPERFAWVGRALAERPEPELLALVARSMAASPSVQHIDALIHLLSKREARGEARAALQKLGSSALAQLERALSDHALPRAMRRHLPRTISRFESPRAAEILLRFLPTEPDDAIQFKILRGLGRLRADSPHLPVDRQMILALARDTLRRTITALHWRIVVDWMRARDSRLDTSAGELLSTLLGDLEQNLLERVFRLLHIMQPTEDLRMIYDGARSQLAKIRAGSLELLEHVAPEGIRDGILGLVDQAADEERLRNASAFYDPPGRDRFEELRAATQTPAPPSLAKLEAAYAQTLGQMLHDPSGVLRSVAGYHIAELGFGELRDEVAAASLRGRDTITSLTERALHLLEGRRVEAPSAT